MIVCAGCWDRLSGFHFPRGYVAHQKCLHWDREPGVSLCHFSNCVSSAVGTARCPVDPQLHPEQRKTQGLRETDQRVKFCNFKQQREFGFKEKGWVFAHISYLHADVHRYVNWDLFRFYLDVLKCIISLKIHGVTFILTESPFCDFIQLMHKVPESNYTLQRIHFESTKSCFVPHD